MPDQSPAERERAQWRTLPEAVAHICAADGCDKDDAHRQLRKALADGALGMLRWEDGRPEPGVGGATILLDDPPASIPEDAEIDWDAGIVRDEWGEVGPRDRVLLIHRLKLAGMWNISGSDSLDPPSVSRKQARTRQILRFRECQQRRRHWLALWDIADWIASDRGTTDRRDEQLRAQGYNDLLSAILAGEFDQHGRTCVLYLAPDPGKLRLTVELLREMRDFYAGATTINDQVLSRCWVPRALAQQWFDRLAVAWPRRFDPIIPTLKRQRPSEEDLDRWMSEHVRPGSKYESTIGECCRATGARVRDAKIAWKRLSPDIRPKRGRPRKEQ